MFDLEQSIGEWRQRMLARGIKSPEPMEELESHLRDEIERQMKSGADAHSAFDATEAIIGQPDALKTEFIRAGGFPAWLGLDQSSRTHRILGALWMARSLWDLKYYAWWLGHLFYFTLAAPIPTTFPGLDVRGMEFEIVLDLTGIVAGFCLFRSAGLGRWVIWFLAILQLFDFISDFTRIPLADLKNSHFDFYGLSVFDFSLLLVTLWLLRPRRKIIPAA